MSAWFLLSTLKAELTIHNTTWQPNTIYPYTATPIQIHPVSKVFQSASPNPNQWTMLSFTWPGGWPEGGMPGQRSPRTAEREAQLTHCLRSILAASRPLALLELTAHIIIKLTAHIKVATHFLMHNPVVCLQVLLSALSDIPFFFVLPVSSQLLTPSNFKIHDLHYYGLSISLP